MPRVSLRRWPSMVVLPAYMDLPKRDIHVVPYINRESSNKIQAVGNYGVIRGILFALYRIEGDLFVRVRDAEYRVSQETRATLHPGKQAPDWLPAFLQRHWARFTLLQGDSTVIQLEYRRPAVEPMLPAQYYDDEGEDFLLFLSNVLGEPGKRELVYQPTRA